MTVLKRVCICICHSCVFVCVCVRACVCVHVHIVHPVANPRGEISITYYDHLISKSDCATLKSWPRDRPILSFSVWLPCYHDKCIPLSLIVLSTFEMTLHYGPEKKKHRQNSHQIIHLPRSEGVSKGSEQMSERSGSHEQSKRMSEQCVWIFYHSGP